MLCGAAVRCDKARISIVPLQKVRIYFFRASSDWRNVLVIVLVSCKGRAFIPVMKMGNFLDHSDYYFGVQFERSRRQCICQFCQSILLKVQKYLNCGWMWSVRSRRSAISDVRVNCLSKKIENAVSHRHKKSSRMLIYSLILSAYLLCKIINDSIHCIDWIGLINTAMCSCK